MSDPVNDIIIDVLKEDKTKGIHLLFSRYYHPLVVFAGHFLKDKNKADDIVQELFVRLWEDDHLQHIPIGSLASYLHAAVRNACLTYKSKKDVLHDSKELTGIEIPAEIFISTDDERINQIMLAIEQLPERSKQVIDCVMLRGLKYKEAAEEMKISVNTVKFLLKEAIRKLRMNLSTSAQQILCLIFRKFL